MLEKKLAFKPGTLILIFIVITVIMITSAVVELRSSKAELYQLMQEQTHSLLETLIISSRNSLKSNHNLDELINKRLLNNAGLINILLENGKISNSVLNEICESNEIYRINIFDRFGRKIYYSHEQEHFNDRENISPQDILKPIFENRTDTLRIGLKRARFEPGFRFAVAVATEQNGAIVLNVDAGEMLKFRKDIGFGVLLQRVAQSPDIIYAALQDSSAILAAAGKVSQFESLYSSEFLVSALQDSLFKTRITIVDSMEVFEAVHPFEFGGYKVGLFRLGVSTRAIDEINNRIYRRLIMISVVLTVFGFIVFSVIFIRQRYSILHIRYKEIETYSSGIIENVKEAIIVLNANSEIQIFNKFAEQMFGVEGSRVLGKGFEIIQGEQDCKKLLRDGEPVFHTECSINGRIKYVLVSRSTLVMENDQKFTVLIIRDMTEQKALEQKIQRSERMSAMGELASGVAHEIRNPLNTIGTIVQQLDRDFEPAESSAEYHDLARLVYKEVKRINATIQDFLRFSRPEPLKPEQFELENLVTDLEKEYRNMFSEKNIVFEYELKWKGPVNWDRIQITQVFRNLIQNSVDALQSGGKIELLVRKNKNGNIEIDYADSGPGIPAELFNKIFNLYFTTKAKGTGIGLSIVQKIIYEHEGMIELLKKEQNGVHFKIQLPVNI